MRSIRLRKEPEEDENDARNPFAARRGPAPKTARQILLQWTADKYNHFHTSRLAV